jgi:flagellar biosynthetic protein FliQ
MSPEQAMTIGRQALEITFMIAAPLLGAALITGLVISIFQAATQINEMTLSFIPKLLAIFLALALAGPWILQVMLDYIEKLYTSIPWIINGG